MCVCVYLLTKFFLYYLRGGSGAKVTRLKEIISIVNVSMVCQCLGNYQTEAKAGSRYDGHACSFFLTVPTCLNKSHALPQQKRPGR